MRIYWCNNTIRREAFSDRKFVQHLMKLSSVSEISGSTCKQAVIQGSYLEHVLLQNQGSRRRIVLELD